jgi:hypothetical protein
MQLSDALPHLHSSSGAHSKWHNSNRCKCIAVLLLSLFWEVWGARVAATVVQQPADVVQQPAELGASR